MKTEDLRLDALLDLAPEGGPIHFAGERALLLDVAAMGLLRQQLVHLLGITAAREVLTRFGYSHGWRSAEALEHRLAWSSTSDWQRAGGRLHRLQGVVSFEPTPSGDAFARGRWPDSWEADQHLLHNGRCEDPVCWTLSGYASGYLSRAFGEQVVARETHCRGRGDPECVMEAVRGPAGDAPSAPLAGLDDTLRALTDKLHQRDAERRTERHVRASEDGQAPHGIVARSAAMRRTVELALHVAPVASTVFITGPSGAGKERIARLIHDRSPRSAGPFVAINCGALPRDLLESELFGHRRGAFTGASTDRPGLFEAARGGTLLLDEVGEIPHDVQVRLLRVLQERRVRRVGDNHDRPVDVRLLAATHQDIDELVASKRLREDFVYRLRVLRIHVPPLSERRDDILPLATAFLREAAARADCPARRFSTEAVQRLLSWRWPGNVRELHNAIEHGAVMATGDAVQVSDLPPELSRDPSPVSTPGQVPGELLSLAEVERAHVLAVLAHTGGRKAEAARLLGIGRATLYRKLAEWSDEA